jgi:hypothetical protein
MDQGFFIVFGDRLVGAIDCRGRRGLILLRLRCGDDLVVGGGGLLLRPCFVKGREEQGNQQGSCLAEPKDAVTRSHGVVAPLPLNCGDALVIEDEMLYSAKIHSPKD